MNNKESDVDLSSPISCLPDHIVLEIFHNKIMDLKTLCLCGVVSKRFYAIVHQVNTIRTDFPNKDSIRECREKEWVKSISMFERLKSVYIQIPDYHYHESGYLCKWKLKMRLNGFDSLVIVSPASIYDNKGLLLVCEDKKRKPMERFFHALCCLLDAHLRAAMSWCITMLDIPLLENISITDSENLGTVSVDGRERIDELRKWRSISSFVPRVSECYLSSLELPVSGYVMKGVTLVLYENKDLPDDGNYDRFIDDNEIDYDKRDTEEAAYYEAMMEIFKKHKGSFVRTPPNDLLETLISKFTTAIQGAIKMEY